MQLRRASYLLGVVVVFSEKLTTPTGVPMNSELGVRSTRKGLGLCIILNHTLAYIYSARGKRFAGILQ